jgi:hypothetical protein
MGIIESKIKWYTADPKHDGIYIVTSFDSLQKINICHILERVGYKWMDGSLEVRDYNIKAWCKISEIEPYKE